MGSGSSRLYKINFEDMQYVIKDPMTLIINTLDTNMQDCLIHGTMHVNDEVAILNEKLKNQRDVRIVVYGLNASDMTVQKKYEQLMALGFYNTYVYGGGLFEWLLLQDVYGAESFPTTTNTLDVLKYKGRQVLNMRMLTS